MFQATMPWTQPLGVTPVYIPYWQRPTGVYVDILQACCGNAYRYLQKQIKLFYCYFIFELCGRRSFFDEAELLKYPKVCMTVDDVWISGYLATYASVPRAIISKRLDPDSPSWKSNEILPTLKLSRLNIKTKYKLYNI